MLLKITRFGDVDVQKLMRVYSESNSENAEDLFPGEDAATALKKAEEGFTSFLRDEFFADSQNACWVLEEDGEWVSALRTTRIAPGHYHLEALETRPDLRRRGYSVKLLGEVTRALSKEGPFRLTDCVGKRNTPSLGAHLKSGFEVVSNEGYDPICRESSPRCWGLEYRFPAPAEAQPAAPFAVVPYTAERLTDVLLFEMRLRAEEDFWGWDIDRAYIEKVEASFSDPSFADSVSLLAMEGGRVIGRIDASAIKSRFDGSTKAYLDWICVLKSRRHRGAAQTLLSALKAELARRGIDSLVALTAANEEAQRFYRSVPNSKMGDVGIWIDVP